MESAKIRASSVSQETRHVKIVPTTTDLSAGDLILDSGGDGTYDIVLPAGAFVTGVSTRHSAVFNTGDGSTVLVNVGTSADADAFLTGAAGAAGDLEHAGNIADTAVWGVTASDNIVRITVTTSAAVSTVGVGYVWVSYRFAPDKSWSQDTITNPA